MMLSEIAIEAYALPGTFHRDPADRILVAAARREGLTLVTADDTYFNKAKDLGGIERLADFVP